MAFTYTEDLTVDADFVRFHTYDTIENEHQLSNAIITSLLATEPTKENAVIGGLTFKMQALLVPDIEADELSIEKNKEAADGYRRLISDKKTEFDIPTYVATVTYTYRADSNATEEPF